MRPATSFVRNPLFILIFGLGGSLLGIACGPNTTTPTELTNEALAKREGSAEVTAPEEPTSTYDASPPACLEGSTLPCYTGPVGTRNVGPCTDGIETCEGKAWSVCRNQVVPQPEQCNGVDDDCNGLIDDQDNTTGTSCTIEGLQGPCAQGTQKCQNGAVSCVPTTQPSEEICDGKDNDCDGKVDELFACQQGPAKEGERCDPTGESEGVKVACQEGLVCLKYGDSRGNYCHVPCQPNAPGQCSHNTSLTCVATQDNSGGVCLQASCLTNADCPGGYQCETRSNGQGNLCFPKRPTGPYGQGALCQTPVEKSGCKEEHRCVLSKAEAKQGVCAKTCQTREQCPTFSDESSTFPSQCISLGNNGGYCLIPCQTGDKVCPMGLSCQGAGAQRFCLAP